MDYDSENYKFSLNNEPLHFPPCYFCNWTNKQLIVDCIVFDNPNCFNKKMYCQFRIVQVSYRVNWHV